MGAQDVPTVFIVDDDADVRESLQELLEIGRPALSVFWNRARVLSGRAH